MSEEKVTIELYCKFCEKKTKQEFMGENRKQAFTITFYCPECGSYHTFEFFGSQFEQPAELE
ncbi:MAG: hypothetical protein ACTSYD_01510 [Candidatus Heimdallarchaeaceae archaeon]